jgi:hypothetical protein
MRSEYASGDGKQKDDKSLLDSGGKLMNYIENTFDEFKEQYLYDSQHKRYFDFLMIRKLKMKDIERLSMVNPPRVRSKSA